MKRDFSIDVLRVISVVYIVCFWHLMNYVAGFPGYANPVTNRMVTLALGVFVFISGYFAANFNFSSGVYKYYFRRIVRIIPLYYLALFLFQRYEIISDVEVMPAVFAASMFGSKAPHTLWFVCMLVVFYLITPLLIKFKSNNVLAASVVFFVFSGIVFDIFVWEIDLRLLLYFPCFVGGVWCLRNANGNVFLWRKFGIYALVGFLITAIPNSVFVKYGIDPRYTILADIPFAVFGAFFVFNMFRAIDFNNNRFRIIEHLSYASFCAYLFHRPIYQTLKVFFDFDNEFLVLACFLGIGCPVVFTSAWCIQRFYDFIVFYSGKILRNLA